MRRNNDKVGNQRFLQKLTVHRNYLKELNYVTKLSNVCIANLL